ncbi:MAG TPA: hypothetical protein VFL13_00900 [Candidatus Baltobacteraceae bacterium]|nr:hypothetical protein [Candidatus Baltobacteraceae bacterium]
MSETSYSSSGSTPSQSWTTPGSSTGSSAFKSDDSGSGDAGKALLVGVLGGLLSAAGYLVYQRLPDDQKEKLQSQARTLLQQRISELRQNFNI